MIRLIITFLFVASVSTVSAAQPGDPLRLFSVDDLLALESIAETRLSPAGDRAALTLVSSLAECPRAGADSRTGYNTHFWRTEACSEVHIATGSDLTRLAGSDVAGYFAPHWSPSGERLGFLSLDHDGSVHVWVWHDGEDPVQVTRASIDPEFTAWSSSTEAFTWSPFDWINDDTIIVALADRGVFGSQRTPVAHPGEVLETGWAAQAAGDQVTADPLYTAPAKMDFPNVSLVRINVESRETKEIARGAFRALRLSPKTSVALVSEVIGDVRAAPEEALGGTLRYRTPQALSSLYAHTRVGRLDLEGDAPVSWFDDVFDMTASWFTPDDQEGGSAGFSSPLPAWNGDGSKVLFLGNAEPKLAAAPTVFLYDTGADTLTRIDAGGNIVVSLAWIGETPLYAQLVPESGNRNACGATWCIADEQPTHAFASGQLSDEAPRTLYPAGGDVAWFVQDGDLRAWTASSRKSLNLTKGAFGTIKSVEAISPSAQGSPAVLRIDREDEVERVAVAYDGRKLIEIGPLGEAIDGPSLAEATLSTTGRPGDLALFRTREPDGIRLWAQAGQGGQLRKLAWLNSHLSGISEPETIPLYYQNNRGDELSGFLVLPPGHQDGDPVPMVTYVYPNWIGADGAKNNAKGMNTRFFLNRHPLTSAGYAVLIPFIPTKPPADAGPLCEQIADAVLPAVEAAVETGFVDGSAVGVMGHSYGGYTTASLMTCTERFKAGVAVAGFYNLANYTLSLKHRDRYNGHALGALSGLVETEKVGAHSLFQFGATPWQSMDAYVENSPVFKMDQLSAPMMLVHGELDSVPIDQAEQMYVAARRLSADVTFLRYWGEYHLLYSPANIRDFWNRTLDFLDENLTD